VALQPVISAGIEIVLWWAIFKGSGKEMIAGFGVDSYLAYALWAAFFSRISISWEYEYMMIDEIDSGRINAILVRPVSFYEFYLGQFLGYKLLCTGFSMLIPLAATGFLHSSVHLERFPLSLALVIFYLFFVHTMSYAVSSLAFFYNRIHSLPTAKNIIIWVLSGELFPLDMIPEPFKHWIIALPFSCGVFLPVAYLTGRVPIEAVLQGFVSVTAGIAVVGGIGHAIFFAGRKAYSGTGA